MKNKNHDKNKLPKKLLACAISITVLTQAPIAYADELNQESKEIVEKNQKDKAINENKDEKNIEKDLENKEDDQAYENNENDLDISPEKKPEVNKAENSEEKLEENKNDTNKESEEIIEWEKTSNKGEEVTEVIKDGTRYNKLESNKNNDNGLNTSNYSKDNLQTDPKGNTNFNVDFIDESEKNKSRFGVFLHHKDNNNNIFVGYDNLGWFWEYKLNGEGTWLQGQRVPTPDPGEKNSLSISLKSDGQLNATNNGESVFDTTNIPNEVFNELLNNRNIVLKAGTYGSDTTKVLVKTDDQENVPEDSDKKLEKGPQIDDSMADYDTIKDGDLEATIDKVFPRIKEYTYKGHKFLANQNFTDTLKVNGVEVRPEVSYEKVSENEAKYRLDIKDEENYIDALLDLRMKILKNQVHFDIVDIKNNNNIKGGDVIDNPKLLLSTIDFRDNFLVSVSSSEENAKFDGARMSTNTHHKGDVHLDVENPMTDVDDLGFMYGFVTNKKLSAGVWSNSQFNYGGGGNDYTRLTANKKTFGEENILGLASSPYIYQLAHKNEDGTYKVYKERTWEMPSSKVSFAEDLNEDGKIDWQDGAIAYREIMNNPKGWEHVKRQVGQRIAMNFGSQAQNPFLTTLDGIKKVYLNTDGLGQMVLHKGYGSEGHDSGHLDYKDIGKRMGGVEDFNKLLDLAKKYGARIGIHVNASETYPESDYFNPERLRKDRNGNFAYGWNWLDQGINIDASYDLADNRFERFKDLKELVGDRLDFIYVDVWGNGQSGNNNAWATHQIAKELNDLGWGATFEWGYAGEYDSTFQHWAADLTYGGYSLKGINSNIVRFIRNHQKDSWVGNYPAYGGAAVNPLLGGYDMKDFEGWQGRNDWAGFMENIFKTNLPSKFVQHFKVYEWKNGDPVNMQDNNEAYKWTPEMEIKLRNENKEGYDELVINRKSNDLNNEGYYQRTMKLNGKVVFDEGNYLLPWIDGKGMEKLYHFNPNGGETSWDVLDGWSGKVYVYELTDLGKANEKIVEIKDGKLNLDAKANTAYVVYKQKAQKEDIKWSEGMGIEDVGFNSKNLDSWEIKGEKEKADVVLSQGANPMLKIEGNEDEISLSQKIKGLKANTNYAIYVGVDNRADSKAFIEIDSNGKTYSNYTKKSIAKNYVQANAHNTLKKSATVNDTSYFQNMYVFFTTGDNPENTIVRLKRAPGEGATYFDDLRVFENKSQMYENDHDIKKGDFFQDFEEVPQGIFPFVIGNVEGVQDNRTHLAEKHAPYTQKGWNGKVINDVIDGKWSLKTNGLTGRNRLVYQTIPQNFRFEEGKTYQVEFDYEAGSDGTYAFVIGDGEYQNPQSLKTYGLGKSWQEEKKESGRKAKFLVEGGSQKWIGILSTTKSADTQGTGGNEANFRAYKDFILDNLLISEVELTSKLLKENFLENYKAQNNLEQFQEESVEGYQDALARVILANDNISPQDMQKLIDGVYEKQNSLIPIKKAIDKDDISKMDAVAQSGEGIENAFDQNPSTIWHSPWSSHSMGESATLELKNLTLIKNFAYLPRQNGSNGRLKSGIVEIQDTDGKTHKIEFKDFANDSKLKVVEFENPINAVKIKITPTGSYGDEDDKFLSAAEFIFGLEDIKKGHEPIDYDKLYNAIENSIDPSLVYLKENFDIFKENDLISQASYQRILAKLPLDKAKVDALKELENLGIESEIFLDKIRNAKTIEGVKALKDELVKAYKTSESEDDEKIEDGKTDEEKPQDGGKKDEESPQEDGKEDEEKPEEDGKTENPEDDEKSDQEKPQEDEDKVENEDLEDDESKDEETDKEKPSADKKDEEKSDKDDDKKSPELDKSKENLKKDKANYQKTIAKGFVKEDSKNVKTGIKTSTNALLALIGSALAFFKIKKKK